MSEILKERIRTCFNKAANTYDQHCAIQRQACSNLIDILHKLNLNNGTMIDLACGTGISTQYIIKHLKFDKIYAIDFCENLIEQAIRKINNSLVEFILSDFDLKIFPRNEIDFVLCNMGLQWSLDILNTFQVISSYLKHSGKFAFTIPIHNTFPELKSHARNDFYKPETIIKHLNNSGLKIQQYQENCFIQKFNSPIEAIRSIKSVGANQSKQVAVKKIGLSSVQAINNLFIDPDNTQLTYHIGFFIAEKNDT